MVHREERGQWQHEPPEPPSNWWPPEPAEPRPARAEAARDALAQIAAGWDGTYPYGDVLALIDAIDPRVLQAPPPRFRPGARLRRMLGRFAGFFLTWAGDGHRIRRTIGEGFGDGRSAPAGPALRDLPSRP